MVPEGGFFFWIKFNGMDTMKLLDEAKKKNVLFVPGSCFGQGSDLNNYARLNYSYSSNEEIHKGVLRLKAAYDLLLNQVKMEYRS